MKNLIALSLTLSISSCAIIAKNNRQQVAFRGGPEKGITKVISPDGTHDIENGSGSYLLTRSKADIPIKVICPNGDTKSGIVSTNFDWLAGGLGNWWTYFIGTGFDAFSDKAYNIEDISLASYCPESIRESASVEPVKK